MLMLFGMACWLISLILFCVAPNSQRVTEAAVTILLIGMLSWLAGILWLSNCMLVEALQLLENFVR